MVALAIKLIGAYNPMKQVFLIDLEHCPLCGGELKIIAAIVQAPVIERILTRPGPRGRAAPVASRDRSSWPDREG